MALMKFLRNMIVTTSASSVVFSQSAADLSKLRDVVASQAQEISQQEKELATLRSMVEEQRRMIRETLGAPPAAATPATPTATAATPDDASTQAIARDMNSALVLNASQEVRFSESSPTLKLGPADIRLEGYIALAGLFDSANTGGSIGTNFASIPYSNTPEGNSTEFRLSSQRTRVALRVDTKLSESDLAAYLEADFRGTTSGTVAVTSSSFGFRVRQAWIDNRWQKFQISGGQMFSLLTPVRSEVTPDPSEAMMSYAVDAQYLAGLVWDRVPGVRLAYRPHPSSTFALALENPEQQVGSTVRFPAALASTLNSQYNTGTAELRTPNRAPDLVFKSSFNIGPQGRRLHIDTGAILRFFRSSAVADIREHEDAVGIGGNLNIGLDLTHKLHLVLNGFLSSGGGRYIGGLASDVVVRANGDISPIKAHSWVTGLEYAVTRRAMLFGYFSGVYTSKNTTVDLNGNLIGFGYPGSNVSRRLIQEWTTGWGQLLWASEAAGSLQLNTQYSYIRNFPWVVGTGPRLASAHLAFAQIRYNLP